MIVRVAVIDSGVHAAHPHVGGVAGGVGIDDRGGRHDDYVDRLGHGTAVASVIREKAPAAAIHAVKIFDRALTATGAALVAACEWAIEQRMDLVNLSLGTANQAHAGMLGDVVARLVANGTAVIAAAPEGDTRWLPGALPSVLQVEVDWSEPRDQCCIVTVGDRWLFRASGYPRPIPGVPPERNLKGTSFAVANVTGLVAAALAGRDEPAAALQILQRTIISPGSILR